MPGKPYHPALTAEDVPETRNGLPGDPKSWHVGCMVTQGRAVIAARKLFPDEARIDPTADCRLETGREGQPCRICAAANQRWTNRVREVRAAMLEAFR